MAKASTAKKGKKIQFGSNNKKAMLVLVAALFVAIGVAAVLQTQAASGYLTICNSSGSDSIIRMYRDGHRLTEYKFVYEDDCKTMIKGDDSIRVDPDPSHTSIDSYKLGIIGQGYGDCHSYRMDSNPPDSAGLTGVRYKTSYDTNCS